MHRTGGSSIWIRYRYSRDTIDRVGIEESNHRSVQERYQAPTKASTLTSTPHREHRGREPRISYRVRDKMRQGACIEIEDKLLSSHGKRTSSQRVDTRGEILKPA